MDNHNYCTLCRGICFDVNHDYIIITHSKLVKLGLVKPTVEEIKFISAMSKVPLPILLEEEKLLKLKN